MFYTIYKITNTINNKCYIGYHSTNDLYDGYMGSGKILKGAITKYGIENFPKEILYVFPNKEEALLKEKELVNDSFISREDTYNMKVGGEGGWDHTYNDPIISKRRKDAVSLSFKEGRSKGWQLTQEQRSANGRKAFKGKTHTEETRKRISESQKMDANLFEMRRRDYDNIIKTRGYIGKLSKMWGVSHTQVRRFIERYF